MVFIPNRSALVDTLWYFVSFTAFIIAMAVVKSFSLYPYFFIYVDMNMHVLQMYSLITGP